MSEWVAWHWSYPPRMVHANVQHFKLSSQFSRGRPSFRDTNPNMIIITVDWSDALLSAREPDGN